MLGREGGEGQNVIGGVEDIHRGVDEPVAVSLSITSPNWAQVASRSGCSKIERTKVAIMGQLALGTREARLAMKWVRHRCQDASASTAAMAALIPPWASEMTSSTPGGPGPPGRAGTRSNWRCPRW